MSLRDLPPDDTLLFPCSDPEWEMPASGRHGRLCELMFQLLLATNDRSSCVGKDHFVYYDRADPRRCVAPDAFVKLGVPQHLVYSWRAFLLGVPELCIEILSPSDSPETLTFREKLRRYEALGPKELIVFRADGKPGRRLRAWDRIRGHLVQRMVSKEETPCRTLGLLFVIHDEPEIGPALRLADASRKLVPTPTEATSAKLSALAARETALLAEIARLKRSKAPKKRR